MKSDEGFEKLKQERLEKGLVYAELSMELTDHEKARDFLNAYDFVNRRSQELETQELDGTGLSAAPMFSPSPERPKREEMDEKYSTPPASPKLGKAQSPVKDIPDAKPDLRLPFFVAKTQIFDFRSLVLKPSPAMPDLRC